MARIGIAVIGSGNFIRDSHLPAIEASSDLVTLKAIYSRSLSSASKLHSSLPSTLKNDGEIITLYAEDGGPDKSFTDLLSRSDISAVIMALPIPTQPTYIKQALLAGKHVLSEKPIAQDLATAQDLISWYRANINTSKTTWSVAENFRYLSRFQYGASQIHTHHSYYSQHQQQQEPNLLGRVLGFRLRMHTLVLPGNKNYETPWRKTPSYQGGFLLDGGVHFIAGLRVLLGPKDAQISKISAFTAQLQSHLPPIDTVNAIVWLKNGSSGTFSVSFGSTDPGVDYVVFCEKGSVDVKFDETIVRRTSSAADGKGGGVVEETVEGFKGEGNGVKNEVKSWIETCLVKGGNQDQRQSPEEALRDLEILEAMIKSGENNGTPIDLKLQD